MINRLSESALLIIQTILITLLPISLTLYYNNKQDKKNAELQKELQRTQIAADITSKARIEWIQNARKATVDFIDSCYNSQFTFRNRILRKHQGEFMGSQELNIINNQSIADVNKYGLLLSLYFGPDKEKNNELLVFMIETIVDSIVNYNVEKKPNEIDIDEMIHDLKDALRAYYKIEWKRASGKISELDVNELLGEEPLFQKIKQKYDILDKIIF